MKQVLSAAVAVAMALATACTASTAAEPKTEDEKTLYALGLQIASQLKPFAMSEADVNMVAAGLRDGVLGAPPKVELQTYGPKIGPLAESRMTVAAEKNKEAGKAYVEKAVKEAGTKQTASGLVYQILQEGTGASPKPTDTVKVDYRGTLLDGTEFDSSYKKGKPITMALSQFVPCWTEGVQLLKVGGKAKLICPSNIAYGDRGRPGIPPGATLVFEVELLDVLTQ